MTNNEFNYLLLVVASFVIFAAGMSIARIRYTAWLRGTAGRRAAAPAPVPAGMVPARAQVSRAA